MRSFFHGARLLPEQRERLSLVGMPIPNEDFSVRSGRETEPTVKNDARAPEKMMSDFIGPPSLLFFRVIEEIITPLCGLNDPLYGIPVQAIQ